MVDLFVHLSFSPPLPHQAEQLQKNKLSVAIATRNTPTLCPNDVNSSL
jgi:hypothetical protein